MSDREHGGAADGERRAGEGTRTPNRLFTKQVLYQLSYASDDGRPTQRSPPERRPAQESFRAAIVHAVSSRFAPREKSRLSTANANESLQKDRRRRRLCHDSRMSHALATAYQPKPAWRSPSLSFRVYRLLPTKTPDWRCTNPGRRATPSFQPSGCQAHFVPHPARGWLRSVSVVWMSQMLIICSDVWLAQKHGWLRRPGGSSMRGRRLRASL